MSFRTIHKTRRAITALILSGAVILTIVANPNALQKKAESSAKEVTSANSVEKGASSSGEQQAEGVPLATELLSKLETKGRAPKTGYKRTEFYNGWPDIEGCNLRQRILKRDFGETAKLKNAMWWLEGFMNLILVRRWNFIQDKKSQNRYK